MEKQLSGIRRYIGTGEFYKNAVFIAIPVMLQSLIQSLVSLVDNFMVSGLGDVKMSGVNISGQILFVFMVLLNTICTSGGIFLTQYSGIDDKRGMRQAVIFKILMAAASMGLFFIVCFAFPRQVLSLMVMGNAQAGEILDVGVQYIRLMGLIGIPMSISTILASSLRETGDVKPPLVISVIATLVNTFLNWVLIYGNLGAPRLEVSGAAYATIVARLVEMLLFIVYVYAKKAPFLVGLADFLHIDWKLIGTILKKGSMVLFSEMTWVISETVTTALYNGRGGAEVVSGMASSFAIANLFFVSFGGINTATGVILGKTLGRGELDKARREKEWLLTAAIFFGILMAGVGMLTTFLVPVVFVNLSSEAQKISMQMIFMMALFMPMWVFQNAQFSVSRSGGDTLMGVVVDLSTTIMIMIPLVFFLALCTNVGPVLMYMCIKLLDIVKVIIAYFWLKKERWVKNLAV